VANGQLSVLDTTGAVTVVVPGLSGSAGGGYSWQKVDPSSAPQFSGDGRWIYFTGVSAGGQQGVFRVAPDGSGLAQFSPVADWGIES
jgi:hypothetical protein